MIPLRISRNLKTKDIEWFIIRNMEIGFECDILIIDTHRPSTLDDFPHMKEFIEKKFPEQKDDYENPNFIKVLVFTQKEIREEKIKEELTYIVEGLLQKVVAGWDIEYHTFKIKKDKKVDRFKREYVYDYINNYLIKHFGFTKESLDGFKNPTFHFLTQEKTWDKELEKKYKIKFE